MKWEDYISSVEADAKDEIEEQADYFNNWEEMEEHLFMADNVTGNGSGSYTFCAATAAENVAGIIWDDDALQAFYDAGYNGIPTDKGPEVCDVIARCLALYYVDGLEDYFNECKEG